MVYNRLGRFEEAIHAYDYALLIDDSFASAYFNMGNALMNTQQYEQALDELKRAHELLLGRYARAEEHEAHGAD